MPRDTLAALALLASAAIPAFAQRGPEVFGPPLAPQQPGPPLIGYKDPELATVLGLIVPGGGQMYAGRTTKGAILFSVGVAAPIMGILGAVAVANSADRSNRFRYGQF